MPTDDLLQFPDGGRATLVRRHSPTLTKRQFYILSSCPYDAPRWLRDGEYRTARELTRLELMERDPTSVSVFRVTEAGAEVVHRWKAAGFLP